MFDQKHPEFFINQYPSGGNDDRIGVVARLGAPKEPVIDKRVGQVDAFAIDAVPPISPFVHGCEGREHEAALAHAVMARVVDRVARMGPFIVSVGMRIVQGQVSEDGAANATRVGDRVHRRFCSPHDHSGGE